jgi:hypothetical protein
MPSFLINIDDKFNDILSKKKIISMKDLIELKSFIIEAYENEKGFFINKLWLDNLALHTQITIKKSELCYAHGRVLYTALSYYLSKQPLSFRSQRITIWETGTARGFSSLCMAKALYDNALAKHLEN